MIPKEKSRFDILYQKHLTALKLQGKADKTIEAYARGVRRIADFLDRCPDDLTEEELTEYFSGLIESHSWSTLKLDLNGIRFFHEFVLKRQSPWVKMVKPPRVQSLPDVLTAEELALIITQTRDLRFQSFWFITYSMGLRLSETLNLQVGDIDRHRMLLHIRQSKGRKDRFVILPRLALAVLVRLWRSHRHPCLLFPGREGACAAKVMDRGTTQRAFARACQQCGIRKKVSIHLVRIRPCATVMPLT